MSSACYSDNVLWQPILQILRAIKVHMQTREQTTIVVIGSKMFHYDGANTTSTDQTALMSDLDRYSLQYWLPRNMFEGIYIQSEKGF